MGIRTTKVDADVFVSPDTRRLRASKVDADVFVLPDTSVVRIRTTKLDLDVYVRESLLRANFLANSRLKGASNKGGTKNTGTTSLVLDKPAGTTQGDTLVAVISDNAGSNTSITAPSGWNLTQTRQVDGTTLGQAIYYYVVPASAPATFTWTLTGTVNSAGVVNMLGNVGALNVVGTQLNASSVNIVAPSVNVTSSNAMLLFVATIAANTSITPPTGMTENLNSDQGHSGVTTEISFSTPTAAGATGTRTGVAAAAGRNFGTLVAFEVLDIERYDFTADAVLMPSFTADAFLIPAPLSSFFTGVLGRFDATPGHIMPGNNDEPISSYEFTADAVLRRTESGLFTADAILAHTFNGSFASDSVLLKGINDTFSGDAILRRTESGSFTADAYLLHLVSGSFTSDAVLFKTILSTLSSDAILRAIQTGTLTADSLLQVVVQDDFTADAVVLATLGFNLTADAILLRSVASSLTAESILRRIETGSITADALLLRIVNDSFLANAILLDTIEGSFTADARLYPRPESLRPPGLGQGPPDFVLIGDVPSHLRSGLPNVRLQPGGTMQVGQGRYIKRVKSV